MFGNLDDWLIYVSGTLFVKIPIFHFELIVFTEVYGSSPWKPPHSLTLVCKYYTLGLGLNTGA